MIWIVILLTFAVDQLTKYLVSHNFHYLESIPIIPKIFYLTYVHNYGAAFGILQGRRELFILVAIVVLAFIIYFYKQLPKDRISRLALGLALGGTIGNLVDRLRLGYVIDFFDFQVWPIFNIADSAIVIGMALFAWILFNDYTAKS
ncbi:signal peptidase II [Anoxybacter fermentans]|uniref:Lipoprotein signal peptidase n=1 Tax=Anoxybacter fermentans TaxID=1323375 RepID=A0A3Q9HRP2_9FIRM|nr:signal peptidase II [Anoxybacter fermentans]AZR73014.1 signal peptidase II [Anoxybacter fermentans]